MAAIDENQLNRFTLRTTTHIPLQGKVTKRVANKIFVKLFYSQEWRCGVKYDIHFELNQLNYQIQHSALDLIEMHRLFPVLINNPLYHSQSYDASVTHMKRLLACDEHIARKSGSRSIVKTTAKPQRADLNPEQTQAIECIIGGSYNPLPYLLYGPPGKVTLHLCCRVRYNLHEYLDQKKFRHWQDKDHCGCHRNDRPDHFKEYSSLCPVKCGVQ